MRFYDDTKYYHFSTNPTTDAEERSIITEDCIQHAKDFLRSSFKPERTALGNIVKFSGIAVFVIAVALCVVFSSMGIVPGIFYTLGGLLIAFGIMAAIPGQKEEAWIDLPQQAKIPKGIGPAIIIGIGLVIIVLTITAPKLGHTFAFVAAGGIMFVIAALILIALTVKGIIRFSKASKQTVQGRCIGYIKMINNNDDSNHHVSTIVGAPVFEYTYNGMVYQAFQEDDLRTGTLNPDVGEVVELGILPDEPYSIFYRKNTGGKVFAIVMALLALGAGIFLFCMLPAVNDNNGFVVNTMGGQVRMAKAKFDDNLIETYINTTDYTIEYVTVTSVYEIDGKPVMDLSNGSIRRVEDDYKDRIQPGDGVYIVNPDSGAPGLNFFADEWEYSGNHTVIGLPG